MGRVFSLCVDGALVTDEGDEGKRYDGMTVAPVAGLSAFSVGFVLSTLHLLPLIGMLRALLAGMPIFLLLPAATHPHAGHCSAVRRERAVEPGCAVSELRVAIARRATHHAEEHSS
jgi:hypothetical protein